MPGPKFVCTRRPTALISANCGPRETQRTSSSRGGDQWGPASERASSSAAFAPRQHCCGAREGSARRRGRRARPRAGTTTGTARVPGRVRSHARRGSGRAAAARDARLARSARTAPPHGLRAHLKRRFRRRGKPRFLFADTLARYAYITARSIDAARQRGDVWDAGVELRERLDSAYGNKVTQRHAVGSDEDKTGSGLTFRHDAEGPGAEWLLSSAPR
ncbi:hypothetical protein HPB48_009539 [Haemaphysalis longicornis]|uniref:Uncharacterized protein n=1 Tax=Haemaphysalis longicornis TaxID=44386 RepID=A0A9J6G515_HAELO|nr:hypothetical protein HPB48_009539 [Haemaphysalis longicornis]